LTGGVSYDANGNQTNVPLIAGSEMPDALSSLIYDVSNRLIRAENNGATRRGEYDYDPGNKRVYEKRSVNSAVVGEWAYFFGITGQRLGRYSFTVSGTSIAFSQAQASVWFGGKLVQKFEGAAVSWASEDRLGSVGKYLPYGEAKPGASNPAGDNEKFATYTRDSGTGLDYADQRWHVAGSGRFLTSDPYQASGGAGDPGSWNRFGYVGGDPSNYIDGSGLLRSNCSDVKLCLPAGDGSESASPGGGGSASGCSVMQIGSSFVPNLANCYVPPDPPEQQNQPDQLPSCDVLLADMIDDYLEHYQGMTGTGSPLYTGLATVGTPGVTAGTLLVGMGRRFGIDPAFILGIARAESSLGTNPNVRGGRYNIYGNSAHYNTNRYADYRTPTVDTFQNLTGPLYADLMAQSPSAASVYRRYEGEATWRVGFGNLTATMNALFGDLQDVHYSCNQTRRRSLASALGRL
jgi:RHS repeat-associated protein